MQLVICMTFLHRGPRVLTGRSPRTYKDILYHKAGGIARITINRPGEAQRLPARRRWLEMHEAFSDAREDPKIGVVLLTGAGPHTDGKYAFCARRRPDGARRRPATSTTTGVPRLNVLELQKLIRSMPKVVIALVAGYAIGGGHVLHVVCDLTIAADNAIFGQVGPKMGSFDGGFRLELSRAHRRPEEGAGDLVSLPAVQRAARRSTWASSTRRAGRRPRGRGRELGAGDPGQEPARDPLPEERASTPSSTARPASRNSPATRPCSTT